MKRKLSVIAACQDAGGCNAVYPVVEELQRKGHRVCLCASLCGADILKAKGARFLEISQADFSRIGELFIKEKPDMVLLGTSLGFSLEDAFVEESSKRGIKTVAVFDSWVNYSVRFADPLNRKLLKYLPNYICVSDHFVKRRMKIEGVDAERIIITGNPYFDNLTEEIKGYQPQIRKDFLLEYNISDDTLVVAFFSQAIDKTFGVSNLEEGYLGYTQFDALKLLVNAVKMISRGRKVLLIIRPHPKEDNSAYANLEQNEGNLCIRVSNKERPREVLFLSDIVAGMFSIMLVEAYALGKKVLSIQPNLCKENPLILGKLAMVKPLKNVDDILAAMREHKRGNANLLKGLSFLKAENGAKNIITLLQKAAYSKYGQS